MPAKYTIKTYIAGGIYHVFNRGVDKRIIFEDDYDYKVFLNCLKEALISPDKLTVKKVDVAFKGEIFKGVPKRPKNFNKEIQLLAYCLMPNHFHLLLKQVSDRSIDNFMRSVGIRYVTHFNKTHKRIGPLFQSVYKASQVTDEPYLLHLTRYLHRNPLKYTDDLLSSYSSYADYLGKRHTEWVKSNIVLDVFKPGTLPFLKHTNSYQQFVEFDNNFSDQEVKGALYDFEGDDL